MTSKKYLSKKKTAQQTISISPALKDWIERYVRVNHQNNPEDERYRSVSSFYTFVMEKVLDILTKGKTLEDFDAFPDSEIKDAFDRITFRATIPYYEKAVIPNRYLNIDFEKNPLFLMAIRNMYLKILDPHDPLSIKKGFQRVRNFLITNKLSKEFRLDVFTKEDGKGLIGVFEYIGTEKNLHFENCKYSASVFGILGAKVTNCLYSEKDLYCRLDLESTDLLFKQTLSKRERMKLLAHNVSYLINYERMVNDDEFYLWMEMAKSNNFFINFHNEKAIKELLSSIEKDLKEFGEKDNLLLNLLKFFESIHWIFIENEKELTFQIKIPKEKYDSERKFMLDYLSSFATVNQENNKFYLKKLVS